TVDDLQVLRDYVGNVMENSGVNPEELFRIDKFTLPRCLQGSMPYVSLRTYDYLWDLKEAEVEASRAHTCLSVGLRLSAKMEFKKIRSIISEMVTDLKGGAAELIRASGEHFVELSRTQPSEVATRILYRRFKPVEGSVVNIPSPSQPLRQPMSITLDQFAPKPEKISRPVIPISCKLVPTRDARRLADAFLEEQEQR
ncbi:hypothetical protein HDU93_004446, partial [Gonapodya sp. JEL0774]